MTDRSTVLGCAAAALLLSCRMLEATPPSAEPAPPVAEPHPSSVAADKASAEAEDGLITDEECLARGGRIATEQTEAHLRRRPLEPGEVARPYRVCRVPSPESGRSCLSSSACGRGRCRCVGELAGPDPARDPALLARDGSPATGLCSDEPLPSGTWWCLVEDGKVVLHGLIID